MNSTQAFFSYLSERFRKENDLSDITWAMCHSCPSFLKLFLTYFFDDIPLDLIESIIRERVDDSDKSSRVDFLIQVKDNDPYLIEVKINDKNHHFKQYKDAYNIAPERFGYITNYPIYEKNELLLDNNGNPLEYKIKEWTQFYKHLEDHIKCVDDPNEKNCIEGYLAYLQSVCGITIFTKPMNFNGIYSLYELLVTLKSCISYENDNFCVSYYNGYYDKSFIQQKMCFKLVYKNQTIWKGANAEAYGYISLYYNQENPSLYIYFDNKNCWGKPIYELLKENAKRLKRGPLFKKPSESENEKGFYFFQFGDQNDEKTFNKEFSEKGFEEQKKMLGDFVCQVFEYINTLIQEKQQNV